MDMFSLNNYQELLTTLESKSLNGIKGNIIKMDMVSLGNEWERKLHLNRFLPLTDLI